MDLYQIEADLLYLCVKHIIRLNLNLIYTKPIFYCSTHVKQLYNKHNRTTILRHIIFSQWTNIFNVGKIWVLHLQNKSLPVMKIRKTFEKIGMIKKDMRVGKQKMCSAAQLVLSREFCMTS